MEMRSKFLVKYILLVVNVKSLKGYRYKIWAHEFSESPGILKIILEG